MLTAPTTGTRMDPLFDIIAHVTGSFVSSPEYRAGFLAAVMTVATASLGWRMVQAVWKTFRAMFKPAKLPVTKDGPTPFDVVSRSVQHAVGFGVVVYFLAQLR